MRLKEKREEKMGLKELPWQGEREKGLEREKIELGNWRRVFGGSWSFCGLECRLLIIEEEGVVAAGVDDDEDEDEDGVEDWNEASIASMASSSWSVRGWSQSRIGLQLILLLLLVSCCLEFMGLSVVSSSLLNNIQGR